MGSIVNLISNQFIGTLGARFPMQQLNVSDKKMVGETLKGPLAWAGENIHEKDYKFTLGSDCINEIETVLKHLQAHPLPTIILDPADFQMPHCETLMRSIKRVLDDGCGFALLDRIPTENLKKTEAKAIYWLLSSMLSRPVAQKLDGTMIYDVQDTGAKASAGSGVRPDKTNIDLTFHNDNSYNNPMPDYVGLLCLKPAKSGGVSKVMSFYTAHNMLLKEAKKVLPRLYEQFIFDRQREFFDGEDETITAPIFCNERGFTARLGIHQIKNGYHMVSKTMDLETSEAIVALEDVFNKPELQFSFTMEQGQIQYVNNRVIGHSRTEFQDFEPIEERRHLVRLWMRDGGDRSYPG